MNVQIIDENNIVVDGVNLESLVSTSVSGCTGCHLQDSDYTIGVCGELCYASNRQDFQDIVFLVKSQQEAHDAVVEEGFHSGLYNFDDLSSVVKFWYSCDNPSNYQQMSS